MNIHGGCCYILVISVGVIHMIGIFEEFDGGIISTVAPGGKIVVIEINGNRRPKIHSVGNVRSKPN